MIRVSSKRRARWIKRVEAERLLRFLPAHQAEMARLTLCTGLRQSNVAGLEWSQIDMQRRVAWVHPDQAKAHKAIPAPLNDEAVEVNRRSGSIRSGCSPSRASRCAPSTREPGSAPSGRVRKPGLRD